MGITAKAAISQNLNLNAQGRKSVRSDSDSGLMHEVRIKRAQRAYFKLLDCSQAAHLSSWVLKNTMNEKR